MAIPAIMVSICLMLSSCNPSVDGHFTLEDSDVQAILSNVIRNDDPIVQSSSNGLFHNEFGTGGIIKTDSGLSYKDGVIDDNSNWYFTVIDDWVYYYTADHDYDEYRDKGQDPGGEVRRTNIDFSITETVLKVPYEVNGIWIFDSTMYYTMIINIGRGTRMGFYRYDFKDEGVKIFDESPVSLSFIDGVLYGIMSKYMPDDEVNENRIVAIDRVNNEISDVDSYSVLDQLAKDITYDDWIYYIDNEVEDDLPHIGSIKRMKTDGSKTELVRTFKHQMIPIDLILVDGFLYYTLADESYSEAAQCDALLRLDVSKTNASVNDQELIDGSMYSDYGISINEINGWVYYFNSDLTRVSVDGSEKQIVA
jgi:hypothetical protein